MTYEEATAACPSGYYVEFVFGEYEVLPFEDADLYTSAGDALRTWAA